METQTQKQHNITSHMKLLHFLARFRSLLKSKESSPCKPRHDDDHQQQELNPPLEVAALKVEEDENEEVVLHLQKTVKKLLFGNLEEKEKAAIQIEKLAREDVKTRKVMAELGVVQVLVSMVDSEVVSHQEPALKALLQLSHGNYSNKVLMLKAGICSKLPKTIEILDKTRRHDFSELLLSLSSLPNTQFPVSTSQILQFLIQILNSESTEIKTKELCVSTINNLSLALENAGPLVSNGAIPSLLRLISTQELSEKSLSSLGQLVVTQMGKKAMEESCYIPESLIEILTWENKPKCQEYSAYILMVLAHQSWSQREKMAKAGIVEALLEVALLGSPLVQKRAVKLLQWFKDERNVRMGPHSGPQTGRVSPVIGSPRTGEEGRRMMKNLVKQSLHKNMEMITRRGNLDYKESSDGFRTNKSLVISTSSKSLPY